MILQCLLWVYFRYQAVVNNGVKWAVCLDNPKTLKTFKSVFGGSFPPSECISSPVSSMFGRVFFPKMFGMQEKMAQI